LQYETLSLNEVCNELIGEKKEDFDFSKIKNMNSSDWKNFFAYNLQDSALTYKLTEKLWPDIFEMVSVMKEPLFNVSRNGMSSNVEDYIIHNLFRYNEIAEKRPSHDSIKERRDFGKYTGAFVFQPKPGLYENVAMFDFTSMYSSVIVTYNLCLSSFMEKKTKDSLEVDVDKNKYYFSKKKEFFPLMLEELIEKRKKYKEEYKKNPNPLLKARNNAFKLLINAAYGYQGFFGARYYCREAAASTAALARWNILKAIDDIKKQEYSVIYSDTDSIALLMGKSSKKEIIDLLKKINSSLPGIMELELEDFYERGLFVSKRTTSEGAKKKYALIDKKGKIKVTGFETIRSDWSLVARETQFKVLDIILKEKNIVHHRFLILAYTLPSLYRIVELLSNSSVKLIHLEG